MCHAEFRKAAIITLEGSDWSGIFTTFLKAIDRMEELLPPIEPSKTIQPETICR